MTGKCSLYWLLALALPALGTLRAAEEPSDQEDAEAKEAAQEDELASKMDAEERNALKYFVVKGTLFIDASAKGPVVGRVSGKEGTYLIKLENKTLFEPLAKLNNKEVTLGGKLRNRGKYLIVKEVRQGAQPTMSLSDPRGL